MSRKVYVTVKFNLIIEVDEGIEASKVIDEMSYDPMSQIFVSQTNGAFIADSSMENYEITDSK
jgi:hypothetical protein